MTLPFGLLIALLGHPWIALASTLANMAGDWAAQWRYGQMTATLDEKGDDATVRAISLVVCVRCAIATSGATSMAVLGGAPADLMFFGLMTCLLLCLAVAQGGLSSRLLWMSAWPVLVGVAIVVVTQFPPLQAAALLGADLLLAVMLRLLSAGTERLLSEWTEMRERNNRLIERLRAERTEAEQAREEARLAGQAKASFLATMSHEIRTPMNGVLGMAQLLRVSAHDDEQRQRIETLIHSGEFLMSILNDILDISKIDAGRLEIAASPEDPVALFDELERLWLPTAEEKGLSLRIEVAPGVPDCLMMDPRRVRQVMFNLIGNALKFTSTGGVTIAIDHVALPDGRIELRVAVRDTGIGIDASALPGLFERFSQADQTVSRQFGGAGLGLAISRQLTELMGGRLWAESTRDEGSCFHLALPLARGEREDGPAAAAEGETQPEQSLTILVVDDNRVNLTVLAQILEALGHKAVCAPGGADALDLARDQSFDLVLLDIHMPGMSGPEMLRILRSTTGANRAIPVVAVSADVLSHDDRDLVAMGFAGHVAKPIQLTNLIAEIARVTHRNGLAGTAA